MLDKREKLKIIIRECADDNQRLLAKMLGISPSTIASWIQRNTYDVELLANCIPDLSAEWLIRGVGNMKIGDVVEVQEKNKSIVEDLKIRISSLEKKVLELENTNKKLEEDKAELRVDKDDFRREKNEFKTKLEEALEKLKTVQSMAQSQMVFSAGDTTIETMELKNHVVNH